MTTKKGWVMTATEFNKHFESNLTTYPTYVSAYEAVEEYHQQETGERKYSGFDSFRQVRKKLIKANQL